MSLPRKRLLSLDVFRGVTIAAMILVNNPGDWSHIYSQLDHAEWNGWTFTDLIFPFFLFIVGVSIVMASGKNEGQPRAKVYLRVLKRAALLFALGLFLNGFPHYDFSTLRVMGVLQRISICYLIAAIMQRECAVSLVAAIAAALLLVYWALMMLVPVPDIGAGLLEKGKNFAAYVDTLVLGKHMWSNTKTWDPEGVISTIPALSTTLFGVLTGAWLKTGKSDAEKVRKMIAAGVAGLAVGLLWNQVLPINKNLWTSSYSVFMAGFALVVLGALYWLIEMKGVKRWSYPFEVFGMNAIALFVLSGVIGRAIVTWKMDYDGKQIAIKSAIYRALFVPHFSPINASLAYAASNIAVLYVVMWAMYKKRVFLKV